MEFQGDVAYKVLLIKEKACILELYKVLAQVRFAKILTKRRTWSFLFYKMAELQSTIHPIQDSSRNALKGKDALKFRKLKKYIFAKLSLFVYRLSPAFQNFLLQQKMRSKKNVSCEFSEILGNLPGKGLQ